jgi:hypothetical protein
LSDKSKDPKRRAAAEFKKVRNAKEGAKALSEYETAAQTVREKTVRLRALRLHNNAAECIRLAEAAPHWGEPNHISLETVEAGLRRWDLALLVTRILDPGAE